mmetsp:Transcript_4606/g.16208  ORF Transcript_4606/g.16208 Transcript_4606/m.16208 type:complete len:603 (+) Transcript_4606:250-2058(+)
MSGLSNYGTPLTTSAISSDPLADPFDLDDPLESVIEIQRPPRQTEQPNTFASADTQPLQRDSKVRFGPLKLTDKAKGSEEVFVLRVWHNDNLFKSVEDAELQASITSFKSAIVNGMTTALEVRDAIAGKLHIEDPQKFKLYAIRNEKKVLLEDTEKVKNMLASNSGLKFALLLDDGTKESDVRTLVGVTSFSNVALATNAWEPLDGDVMYHRRLLNSNTYAVFSSCVFHLKTEKVHTLRPIVEIRCPVLLTLPQIVKRKKVKKANGHVTVTVKEDSFVTQAILTNVLEFAYCDSIDFTRLNVAEVVHLTHAAGLLELPRLVWLCEHYLFTTIGMHNVFQMLRAAHELQMKSIKNVCIAYAHANWAEFSASKVGLEVLGIDLFQDLCVMMSQKKESDTSKLQEDAPPSTLLLDFRRLHDEMELSDGVAECTDGVLVPFHKAILAAHQRTFHALFTEKTGKKYTFPVSSAAFKSMLQFVYYGECDLTTTTACEVIESLVMQYRLPSFRDKCDDVVSTQFDIETVLRVLMLTYMPLNQDRPNLTNDLKTECLNFIVDNFAEINVPGIRAHGHAEIAFDLLELLHNRKRGTKRSVVGDRRKKLQFA